MFSRSILIFIFLLICLGIGTIWIVQKETGTKLVSSQSQFISSYKLRDLYLTNKIRLQYWWSDLTGNDSGKLTSVRYEETDPKQPGIVKWQDEKGTWHFEYQKIVPSTNEKDSAE